MPSVQKCRVGYREAPEGVAPDIKESAGPMTPGGGRRRHDVSAASKGYHALEETTRMAQETLKCRECGKRPAGDRDPISPFCGRCDPDGARFYGLTLFAEALEDINRVEREVMAAAS